MANEPRINLALVGEMPANPVRGTVYMSPDTSGNFIKVGVDGSVRTIFDGSNYVLKEESPWIPGEGEGSVVLKSGGSEADGDGAVAHGDDASASGLYSHAEGYQTKASGNYSHAEGLNTTASGQDSHAEGSGTMASGHHSHAEGYQAKASESYSHAEGYQTKASGSYSHTEGGNTTVLGTYSHAEGYYTTAYGQYSHAEGAGLSNLLIRIKRTGDSNSFIYIASQPHNLHINDILSKVTSNIYARVINILDDTTFETDSNASEWNISRTSFTPAYVFRSNIAYNKGSHAEGGLTIAIGEYSHTEGYKTVATNAYEHAQGMFNKSHTDTLFSIGNGDGDEARSNVLEIMQNGKAYLHGVASFDGQTIGDNKTLQYFLNVNLISSLEYDYIFGISSLTPTNLLSSHLIIDRIPEDILPDIEDSYGSLSDYIADIVTDVDNGELYPGGSGDSVSTLGKPGPSNRWEWSGDMMSIDGNDYYIWYCILENHDGDYPIYGLMSADMTLETCIDNSMHSDISNRWSPFEYIIADDTIQDYDDLPVRYTLIYVKEYVYDTHTIGDFDLLDATLYLDTFDDSTRDSIGDIYSHAGVVNIGEYIDYYCENNLNDGASTECTYQEDITFDGETYHMWHCENGGGGYEFYGLMPLSVTADEVESNSKYANPFNLYCPFTYDLDIDEEVYSDDPAHLKTRRCLVTVVPGE